MRKTPILNVPSSCSESPAHHYGTMPIVTVVDDDRAVAASLCAVVRSLGLDVHACSTRQDLLRSIDPTRPGCIILDLGLSDSTTSGLDLLAGIANDLSFPPVIIFTGEPDIQTIVQVFRRGAFDFLLKPSSIEELSASVYRAIDHDMARRGSQHFARSA